MAFIGLEVDEFERDLVYDGQLAAIDRFGKSLEGI